MGVDSWVSVFEDQISDAIIFTDLELRITRWNRAAQTLYGWTQQEVIGRNIDDVCRTEYPPGTQTAAKTTLETDGSWRGELHQWSRTGADIWVMTSVNLLRGPDGRPLGGVTINRDITTTKKLNAALRKNDELYRTFMSQASDGIFLADEYGRYIDVNEAGCKLLGYSRDEILQLTMSDVVAAGAVGDPPLRMSDLREGKTTVTERHLRRKDGSRVLMEVTARMMDDGRFQGIARDISERKRQAELQAKNARLEALGKVAGGIAHDFNNILAAIFGFVELARASTREDRTGTLLDRALATVDKARKLTGQLLTFAHGGVPDLTSLSLTPFLTESIEGTIAGSMTLALDVAPDLWPAFYDRSMLAQAVESITQNAVDASNGRGVLHVAARNTSFQKDAVPGLAAGDFVEISFRDEGPGMSPDVLGHVFDPFYSTKPMNHGLGLSTAFSIVKKHGGTITAESSLSGSTFRVYLRRGQDIATAPRQTGAPDGGRVLVMDDEYLIREVIFEMLTMQGYLVTCVANGEDALQTIREEAAASRPFDALLLDLTIPNGLGGVEVARQLRQEGNHIPIFVMSGYSTELDGLTTGSAAVTGVLRKPFSGMQLAEMLKQRGSAQ